MRVSAFTPLPVISSSRRVRPPAKEEVAVVEVAIYEAALGVEVGAIVPAPVQAASIPATPPVKVEPEPIHTPFTA
jgi:hypothetical protein